MELIHPGDLRMAENAWQQLLAGRPLIGFRVRVAHADGSYRWLSWNPVPAGDGNVYAVARDVTAEREAEERQAQLQAQLQRAATEWTETFDAIEFPMLLLGPRGEIARCNVPAAHLADRHVEDLPGRRLESLGDGEPWHTAAVMAEDVRGGHATAVIQVRDEASGSTWDLTARRVDPHGGASRVLVVMRDITTLIRLQESLRRSETMSALGQIVAGVAHEVRNPLFSMTATMDAFEARYPEGERPRHLAVLREQLQRLTLLMGELLEYGRPSALEFVSERVTPVIQAALQQCAPVAEPAGIAVRVDVPADLPILHLDRLRLSQVFVNLIMNAIQHSPAQGTVTVAARLVSEAGRTWVDCTVSDEGRGFATEDVTRVFEPFFSRRRGGIGLGLALVQRIVEEHGGRVSAGNRPEGGAVILVRLPVREA